MSEALQVIEVPPERPRGVTKRQWRLAALLPRCETAFEACIKAGYTPTTARKATAVITAGLGVAIARKAQEAGELDNARKIKAKAAAHVGKHVAKDALDIQDALNVWATSAKIAGDYPDDGEEALTPQDRLQARAMVLRYCRIAARVAVYRALRAASVADAP